MTTRTSVLGGGARVAFSEVANRAADSNSKAAATGMSRFETKSATSTAKMASSKELRVPNSKRRARP